MSSQRIVIPIPSESSFDSFMRKHILKQICSEMLQAFEPQDLECSAQVHENVLIDDEFLYAMKPNIIKQFTPEQIESIRGRTARRIVVSKQGSEVTFSMEF